MLQPISNVGFMIKTSFTKPQIFFPSNHTVHPKKDTYVYWYSPPCYMLQEHLFQTETFLPDNILHLRRTSTLSNKVFNFETDTIIKKNTEYSLNTLTSINCPTEVSLKVVSAVQVLQDKLLTMLWKVRRFSFTWRNSELKVMELVHVRKQDLTGIYRENTT